MNWVYSILLAAATVLLIGQTMNMFTMRRGDGFSRSMATSFGALGSGLLFGLIAVMLGLARVKASFPAFSGCMVILILPLGLMAMLRMNKLMRSYEHTRWLIACVNIPAALLIAWSAVVRFEVVPSWLQGSGMSSLIWCGALALTAIALLAGRGGKN